MRVFIFLILFPFFLTAQPFQGQKFIGGSVQFSAVSNKEEGIRASSFSISPSIGGMLSDRFAIGLSFGYGYRQTAGGSVSVIDPLTGFFTRVTTKTHRTNLSVKPYVFWVFPISEKLSFNLFTSIGAGVSKTQFDEAPSNDEESYYLTANASPALYYFIHDHFALTGAFGGLSFHRTFDDETGDVNSLSFSLLSNFSLGARYFWGSQKENDE